MKKIEAIIKEDKFQSVKEVLEQNDIYAMTVIDVKGRGGQRGISLQWRVGEYRVDFLPKKLMILVVKDEDCQKVVDIICEVAGSGTVGDGKIFISTIDEVIRIRTKETSENAI